MFKLIFSPRMLVSFLMGFSCGVPLLLTLSVLQAWMKEEGVDLTVIGLFSLVGLPYTLKFLWSPVLDRFTLPLFGRRRGWLLLFQVLLALAIAGLGMSNPAANPWLVAGSAFLVTFFSASQDIVVDAYRREDLSDNELGLGSSLYIYGYRTGMLLASGGGLILADHMPFSKVYLLMAASMLPCVLTTILAPEPENISKTPETIKKAIINPFLEYFRRDNAILMLSFIVLYKIGDTMAGAITIPFYLDIGFSKTEIGAVVKIFGTWAIIAGALAGGVLMLHTGINRCLWLFGFLQALSTGCFAILAQIGHNIIALTSVITFENLSSGMGTAAFVAFMASITNKKFTATQYALLTSLIGVPRALASSVTGLMAKHIGWENFFITCALAAIPGMLLLFKSAPWNSTAGAAGAQIK